MTFSDESYLAELATRNERFWEGSIGPNKMNEALVELELQIEKCVLVSLVPDSGSTWLVRVLDQNGEYLEIDLDMEDNSETRITKLGVPVKARELREYLAATKLSQLKRNAV